MSAPRPTICLNMIVKNEAHVIRRCLDNVRPLIDHWVIVDTGSTDGTQELISEFYADIPGALHERPWKNFGHNRSEAIALCEGKADYILTIDADETLLRDPDFSFGSLDADSYLVLKRRGFREYRIPSLLRTACNWRWEGVVHEQPASDIAETTGLLDGIIVDSPREGARAHDPNIYRRDALMLEAALLDNPDDTRSVFYLAQSYRDAYDYDLAIRYYEQRASMGGWREEIFISLYQLALAKMNRGDPWQECLDAFLKAQAHTPSRVEPIYRIGLHYAQEKNWALAWLFLENAARDVDIDPHSLFLETEIYTWRAKMEAAVAAYWLGHHEEAIALNDALLSSDTLPKKWRSRVRENRDFSLENLARSEPEAMPPTPDRVDSGIAP